MKTSLGIIVIALGGAMADYFTGIGIVPYVVMLVLEFFAWVWSALTASYSLPGWILLIGIICALGFGLVCIVLAVLFFAESKPARKPEYEAYTEDVMFGAKWEWRWRAGGGILDLWCFCPVCQGILVWNASPYDDDILFVCEHCRNTTRAKIAGNHKDDALDVVKREILRRTRTEEYKKAD